MILLDSSVIIELFRKQKKEKTVFFNLAQSEKDFCISSVTYFEVGIGNRSSHLDFWEDLLSVLSVLPFDIACASTAIEIYRKLKEKGNLIDFADLCIGATALSNNIRIATLNKKHFSKIEGLQIID